ncbi:cytochrome P450 1A1-like [Dermacentor andersoni]|uniref:cytochrome P450 1A1-like n=1 Tax=Dermacentor andersoni TaxID=34620 RepID=UPI002417C977|nr:cytochrome P450 2C20-like [Dermacentor andersoni]
MDDSLVAYASILRDWRWIGIALVFAFTCLVSHFYDRVSRYPKGPFPVPVFGNLLALRKVENLHGQAIEWSKTYGDVFTLWCSHNPMVILNSYDVIQEAFLKRKHAFSGRLPLRMRDIQNQGNHDVMFEDYTPYWKALRRVASLAVRKYAATKALERLCTDIVDAYVDTLTLEPQIVDSRKLFFSMLYKLTGASIYGASLNGEEKDILRLEEIDHEYYAASPDGLPSDIAPILGLLYRKREKKIEALYTEYRQIIDRLFAKAEESYKAGSKDNIVHGLISAREEATRQRESDAEYLTKENLVQVVMNLFGGATDTSASALQWMFLRLAKHPEIQKRIQKEIEDCIGTSSPVYEDRERLPFTVACMMETFRCHPFAPIGMPHKTSTDTTVGTAAIPKDTGVLFNVYGVNHDTRFWDEPGKFRPDRFLDPVTGRLRQDAGPLLSFGLGARACPGEKLAHVDIFYILVRFMQRVSCSAIDNASSVDMRSIGSSLFFLPAQRDIVLSKRNGCLER